MILKMNVFFFISCLNIITSFSLAIFIFLRRKQNPANLIFCLFASSIGLWGVGAALFSVTAKDAYIPALFFWKIAYIGIIFIPVFYSHFVFKFLNLDRNLLLKITYILAIIFIGLTWYGRSELFFGQLEFLFGQFYWTYWLHSKNSIYLAFYILFYWVLLTYAFFYLVVNFYSSSGIRRNQLKYLIFGSIFGWMGGEANFLPGFGINIYPYLNILIPIYTILVAYAIFKYRLMDMRVFISRALAFFIAYPILLSIPFILGYQFYPWFYSILGRHWWLAPSGLLATIATFAPVAYGRLRSKMEARLLAEQKRYQKLLLQAASGMVTQHDLGKLAKLIVYILKRAVKMNFAVIFLDDKKEGVYRLWASRARGPSPYQHVSFLYEHPFVTFLKEHKEPIFYEEIPDQLRKSITALEGVNLIVPAAIEDNLLGFVFLGEKENRQPYTDDDINVFRILSHQAAMAVENCVFLEEFKQAQEKIFTAEKLASIGGMADGVAHQIKNRLNQFSVASGELKYEIKDFLEKHPERVKNDPDLKKTLDYLIEIADSLLANVKKTDGVIKGILNFARVEEKERFFSHFSFKEVIDLALELLKVKHEISVIPLEIHLDSSDAIYGVKSQISESVYNVIDNAYEATQEKRQALPEEDREKFVPKIVVRMTQQPTSCLIEIQDNGSGIAKKDTPKIFAPFFTTKSSYKSGTGIGMYVVKRMVEENHHGKVWFVSEVGKGTTFYIELPKK